MTFVCLGARTVDCALTNAAVLPRKRLSCVQQRGVTTACGGKLYMIDVGMSNEILGDVAAWKCIDGKVSIVQDLNPKWIR